MSLFGESPGYVGKISLYISVRDESDARKRGVRPSLSRAMRASKGAVGTESPVLTLRARAEKVGLFAVGGGSAAVLNLALAWLGVEVLGLGSKVQQNFVNLAAMEVSLVYSFFVYRTFVWKVEGFRPSRVFLRELPLYHLSAGAGVLARLALFPALQSLGVHYLVNIVCGISLGAAVNYLLADRFVFGSATREEDR